MLEYYFIREGDELERGTADFVLEGCRSFRSVLSVTELYGGTTPVSWLSEGEMLSEMCLDQLEYSQPCSLALELISYTC